MATETPPIESKDVEPQAKPHDKGAHEIYNTVTDKVGGPSIRLTDNLVSLGGAVVGGIVGAIIGLILGSAYDALLIGFVGGLILGVIGGVVLAGLVLMVIGLARR